MPYACKVFSSIRHVPAQDWTRVCETRSHSVFMDPRFLMAVEKTLGDQSQFWHAVIYDEDSNPAACSSLCTFSVDLLTLAGGAVKKGVAMVRRFWPSFGRVKVLFCGLPVSVGQSHLIITQHAQKEKVLATLNDTMTKLARREKTWFIIYKEFDMAEAREMDFLLGLGYRRGECPAMHEMAVKFTDFEAYCGALKSHYRNDIRRSQRKFDRAGLRATQVHDPAEIGRIYNHELHRLYHAVVEKAEIKLEFLPAEFFLELVRQFPGLISLTLIYQGNRVVAFNWGLLDGKVHHYLFCGMDYQLLDADLYFNLIFHQMDDALKLGPTLIQVGQTADSFKARLGCSARPLFLYIRGCVPIACCMLKAGFRFIFPLRPPIPSFSIFKTEPPPKKTSGKKVSAEAGRHA